MVQLLHFCVLFHSQESLCVNQKSSSEKRPWRNAGRWLSALHLMELVFFKGPFFLVCSLKVLSKHLHLIISYLGLLNTEKLWTPRICCFKSFYYFSPHIVIHTIIQCILWRDWNRGEVMIQWSTNLLRSSAHPLISTLFQDSSTWSHLSFFILPLH